MQRQITPDIQSKIDELSRLGIIKVDVVKHINIIDDFYEMKRDVENYKYEDAVSKLATKYFLDESTIQGIIARRKKIIQPHGS